ncbi:hypothetical protein CHS0354_013020 [Potamilus streckersoni]|uniref:Uncharacterized protein n=1 Tax=Potamilus streckersoni TaxID=2493646 RepID=A0AAE0W480_9BIVA|nr:hypothetical protein CHS0354_013020 [Potamilus streckersoni]
MGSEIWSPVWYLTIVDRLTTDAGYYLALRPDLKPQTKLFVSMKQSAKFNVKNMVILGPCLLDEATLI